MNSNKLILDGHKLLWHKDRVRAYLNGEHIVPITIDCALTRRCSYKCVYCYGQLQENEPTTLTKEHALNFLKDAAEVGVKAVSFVSDGESTCVPFLKDAIVYGKNQGLDMALGTNGYRLNDDQLEEILTALTYLRFNITAGEKARYAEIHGCAPHCYDKVINTIKKCVEIKHNLNLDVTIGLQMVFMPQFADQLVPLAKLGRELGVDYLVIKHCSDDENGSLNVQYEKYKELDDKLLEAESYSTSDYLVQVKWSKIKSEGKRSYSRCFGPPFIMQFSGSGLVAPCGMLFNNKYKKYHIGNITEQRFKDIVYSDRYKEVLALLASEHFDAKSMCGTLCLQHKVNEFLTEVKENRALLDIEVGEAPMHVNFI